MSESKISETTNYLIATGEADLPRMNAMNLIYDANSLNWFNKFAYWRVANVLELGCGNGQLIIAYAKAHPGIQILAIDRSQEQLDLAITAAKDVPNIRFLQGDILDFEFLKQFRKQYQVIHTRFVLTHQPTDRLISLADELQQLVPESGILIMEELNGLGLKYFESNTKITELPTKMRSWLQENFNVTELPRAMKAWLQLISLQHTVQKSSLVTANLLHKHFEEKCQFYRGCQYIETCVNIDEPDQKVVFLESVRQGVALLEKIAVPTEQNPIVQFDYANGDEWLKEVETLVHDPNVHFQLGTACVTFRPFSPP